jgi:hypothetical protein
LELTKGKKIRIFGQVQSGKTAEIMRQIKDESIAGIVKVLVCQNMTAVAKQYCQRMKIEGINVQMVDSNTKQINNNTEVVLLLSNSYRYKAFLKLSTTIQKYVLFLDEYDQTLNNCKLVTQDSDRIYRTFYISATPLTVRNSKHDIIYDQTIVLTPPENYFGVNKMEVGFVDDQESVRGKFSRDSLDQICGDFSSEPEGGMMLIRNFTKTAEMKSLSQHLSVAFPEIPVICYSTEKCIFNAGNMRKYSSGMAVNHMIDKCIESPRIIIVSARLASRGLSFVSSDYTRHITHQIDSVRTSGMRNFIQSLRCLGNYTDGVTPKFYACKTKQITVNRRIKDYNEMLTHLQPSNSNRIIAMNEI